MLMFSFPYHMETLFRLLFSCFSTLRVCLKSAHLRKCHLASQADWTDLFKQPLRDGYGIIFGDIHGRAPYNITGAFFLLKCMDVSGVQIRLICVILCIPAQRTATKWRASPVI